MNQVVPPGFLFRWSFSISQMPDLPYRSGRLLDLPDTCRLPALGELDSKREFADVRLAWNVNGIGVSVEVRGRSRKLSCHLERPRDSDGLNVWIDTRNAQGVHRATRFCHHFCLLPSGGGPRNRDPVAIQIPLSRAREESNPADVSLIQLQADVDPNGYWLEAWLPKEVFIGFDPATSPRLGFHYSVRDQELGLQTLAVGNEFPVESDPSLWQTLDMTAS